MNGTRRALCLSLLALTAFGCRAPEPTPGRFLALEPPFEWHARLEADREVRDRWFATNRESPIDPAKRGTFSGLNYWEPDPRYYFVGEVQFYREAEPLEVITTAGERRPARKVGHVDLPLPDGSQRLTVYQLLDQNPDESGNLGFFLPFKDATSGDETYDAGRYLELDGPPGGPYVLDFNRATNPFCAYGSPENFACPVTPAENRLPVRIAVGERMPTAAP